MIGASWGKVIYLDGVQLNKKGKLLQKKKDHEKKKTKQKNNNGIEVKVDKKPDIFGFRERSFHLGKKNENW